MVELAFKYGAFLKWLKEARKLWLTIITLKGDLFVAFCQNLIVPNRSDSIQKVQHTV